MNYDIKDFDYKEYINKDKCRGAALIVETLVVPNQKLEIPVIRPIYLIDFDNVKSGMESELSVKLQNKVNKKKKKEKYSDEEYEEYEEYEEDKEERTANKSKKDKKHKKKNKKDKKHKSDYEN
eukprot:CAMPEP_0205805014 /NCGR_PEP_ID=MMETSP0205-20121125/8101_1 /ASSEMBLY_ACC=CAM_ASM_000278 /TAXON_ID=36767 /ORGANISM="Euplotes focardii, Strain TN1" /LENGTH=122 /DNA_ID=CAMNT_0053075535 /DNA_START=1213 /DNA_END=1578 /DNA_ORIENTATION=-